MFKVEYSSHGDGYTTGNEMVSITKLCFLMKCSNEKAMNIITSLKMWFILVAVISM